MIMKRILVSIFAVGGFVMGSMASGNTPQEKFVNYVNPFIGTSNYGVTQPGPLVPGGMVSMSPFTSFAHPDHKISSLGWCSTPYVYENPWTIGFTQVNLSGVGCPDFGTVLLMPTVGELEVDFNKYASRLSNQVATPGYYSCGLGDGIVAEMTATRRSTRSRYTYPAGRANVLVNVGQGLTTESGGYLKRVSDMEVEGVRLMGDFCYNQPQAVVPMYFVVRIMAKPEGAKSALKYWKKQPQLLGAAHQWSQYSDKYKVYDRYQRELMGDDIGAAWCFEFVEESTVEVAVGVSYVSIENARENLEKEQPSGVTFEEIAAAASNEWEEALSVVEIKGGSADEKVQFYTGLYHNWVHPNTLSDYNGEYPAMGSGETMSVNDYNATERLTMFSGWDVYRISPFIGALFYPQRQTMMAHSMMQMYRENGALPKFEIAGQDFMVMEGDAALPYLAACYFLGLTEGIDTEELYTAMRKNAMGETYIRQQGKDFSFYAQNHYLPWRSKFDNSVSQALECYIADWALAQMAKDLGKKDDHKMFLSRAMGYKKYFDTQFGLLRPLKANGEFMEGFNPREGENFAPVNGFHEGTSWNYSFAVPYDVQGHIRMFDRNPKKAQQRYIDSLEACFTKGYFDMGNEPDMNYPYLFSQIRGEEHRTQKWVAHCLDTHFKNTPGGLPGNDDAGTMSAWQMLSMMGIYPLCPSQPTYTITTPRFDEIKLQNFTIEAVNRTPENIYIDRIELDGKPYAKYTIDHKTLMESEKLTIYCTDKPKK